MNPSQPFNIWPMNVAQYIKEHELLEVSSYLTWEPSSTNLHPDGLYSEGIFGQIGSSERISKLGYISLNTKILTPFVFKNVIDLKPMYSDLMQGKIYATFDERLGEFVPCDKETVGCDTGYTYFIEHFEYLKFAQTSSHTRTNKIKAIEKAKAVNAAIIEHILVLPAGLRDIKQEGDRYVTEEINKIYTSLLSLCSEVRSSFNSPSLTKLYDGVKYNIQLKVFELYSSHKEFLSGKSGFGQRRYARRALAYGSRNVITGANMQAKTVEDSDFLKHDETLLPLFQAAKMYQPLVINQLREIFYSQIFSLGATRIAAINTKTLTIEYIDVNDKEITNALSSEGMENLINMFQNVHMREKPVIVRDTVDKFYYLFLVYDTYDPEQTNIDPYHQYKDQIYILRNVDDFATFMKEHRNIDIDRQKIRPLTYLEMMYLAVYRATRDKHCTITRYPAIEMGSIYPSRAKIGSTIPSRMVEFSSQYQDERVVELPCYPILSKPYLDSVVVHPSQVRGLGADYDGDTVSANGVMSEEANAEIREYLSSAKSIITPSGKLLKSAATDLTELTAFNLTRNPLD